MRSWSYAALVVVTVMAGGCGTVVDLNALDGGDLGAGKGGNGETCQTGSDCTNGICADGVCCQTACDGVCEACNLAGSLGTCAAVKMGEDPAMECMPKALPDGGVGDAGDQLEIPDGGVNPMAGPCAPSCNGDRACGFPDKTVSCGDTFCNSSVEQGEAVCDGEGHCGVDTKSCAGYACETIACETTCSTDADCDPTFYCDGLHCQPKKQLGITCDNNPDQCASGFCEDDVCCNSHCAAIPGGTCNVSGSVGTCKCQIGGVTCNGACELYYSDVDGDGYGSQTDTGVVGCTGDPNLAPPPGVPASSPNARNDCDDGHNTIHPGSGFSNTSMWPSAVHTPAFDWDCDGVVEREYPYMPGAVCRFCVPRTHSNIFFGSPPPACGPTATTCGGANEHEYLNCSTQEHPTSFSVFNNCCGYGCASVYDGTLFGPLLYASAYVSSNPPCGQGATLTVCGTCDAQGDGIDSGSSTLQVANNIQSCR